MRKFWLALVAHPLKVFVGIGCLCVAFGATVAFETCGSVTLRAISGIEATLKLLTLMESPRTALTFPPGWLILFGWVICVLGWLLLPLVIGAMFESALRRSEADMTAKFTFHQIGKDLTLKFTDEELAEFTERTKIALTEAIEKRGGKQG